MGNSHIRVPPDSTGKKLFTQDHVVGADTVQVQVIHAADPDNPTYIQHVDSRGAASVRFSEGSPLSDAFGNLKVSNRVCLGAYDFVSGDAAALWSYQKTGAGNIEYMSNASTMRLTTGTALGDYAALTTNHHHYYNPGTANLAMMTIALGGDFGGGCRRRWGLIDAHNGVFFKLREDNQLVVGVRSSVSGTPTASVVPQSQWNGDKLDGNGLSGFLLDYTKLNIYWIDYQWLGAGRVRFGVVDDYGNRVVCHTMLNANHNQYPYMSTGTLALGVQVENMAITGGTSEIRLTCASVHSEGDLNYTFWRYVHEFAPTVLSGATHLISLKSTDLFQGKNNVTTGYPESLGLYVSGGSIKLDLYWDYMTIGSATWAHNNGSTVVADTAGTVTLAGTEYRPKTWYLDAGSHNLSVTDIFEKNDYGLDCNADGTPPVSVTLIATPVSGTPTVVGGVQYAELR